MHAAQPPAAATTKKMLPICLCRSVDDDVCTSTCASNRKQDVRKQIAYEPGTAAAKGRAPLSFFGRCYERIVAATTITPEARR